ncbi:hypothetical protein [uncultured Piscinibacter sp.]|uniref:hypothetical protein n=1 Tax=uncultured Piscinibacter sp. TaxID=1131835 RepID=UPI002616670D|nr:hypothetical protein [uncultured Piscinibacter sp.]
MSAVQLPLAAAPAAPTADAADLATAARRWGAAVCARMAAEGYGDNPAAWSDAAIDAGLSGCVGGRWLPVLARGMRDAAIERLAAA